MNRLRSNVRYTSFLYFGFCSFFPVEKKPSSPWIHPCIYIVEVQPRFEANGVLADVGIYLGRVVAEAVVG